MVADHPDPVVGSPSNVTKCSTLRGPHRADPRAGYEFVEDRPDVRLGERASLLLDLLGPAEVDQRRTVDLSAAVRQPEPGAGGLDDDDIDRIGELVGEPGSQRIDGALDIVTGEKNDCRAGVWRPNHEGRFPEQGDRPVYPR